MVASLQVNAAGAEPAAQYGYSDGRDVGGERFVDRWVTYGTNLLAGKPYTVSVAPTGQWGGSDPDGKKLTDGVVGPSYAGGAAPQSACLWDTKCGEPEITVDMGQPAAIAAFRIHLTAGWPWWDSLQGEVRDDVEVLTSLDGGQYVSHGQFDFDLRRKDIPINHMLPDDEQAQGFNFTKRLSAPVSARYVRFHVTPRRIVGISEVQAVDSVTEKPFDLRLALPDDQIVASGTGGAGRAESGARGDSPPENAAVPGEIVEELPTLRCLGVRWLVGGDANRNARIAVGYRRQGSAEWTPALDLFRVDSAGMREAVRPPADQTLYAGSVFGLNHGTAYELQLSLTDPDGGSCERIVPLTTWAEPRLARGGQPIDVAPDNLAAALEAVQPGQILRLHAGTYRGPWRWKSGTSEAPIGIVAAGDGEVVLDGQGGDNVIGASELHDVVFEGLAIRNATWGIAVNGGARITVRRCLITDVETGLVAQRDGARQQRFFLADNVLVGRATWPRTRGIEERGGIRLGGSGHVVCFNRVRGFADAISVHPAYPCAAIDIYGNEISECTDDGIELDGSEHNTRCFENRLTNVFQGISLQPVHGGPVYVFRNALYNVAVETFKLHNGPSGGLLLHNASVKAGMPWELLCSTPVSNCLSRNNLFVGTQANYAFENLAQMDGCDFDFDGFAGRWKLLLKWNGVRFAAADDVRWTAPVYRHLAVVDSQGIFASGVTAPEDPARVFAPGVNDLRLAAGSAAVDAGLALPNVNDGWGGAAPDLGAYEAGQPLPHYGPRTAD